MGNVKFASACIDERGKASGGKAGNQSGKELKIQPYYMHKLGWFGLRPKSNVDAKNIAYAAIRSVNNKNIGYDQLQRETLYNLAKHCNFDPGLVDKPCETDCSALSRVCAAFAGIMLPNYNTSTEKDVLLKSGKFDLVEIKKESDCTLGMILVTKTKGHTVIVVDGPEYKPIEAPKNPIQGKLYYTIQKGDTLSKIAKKYNTTVAAIQKLNPTKIKDINKIQIGWQIRVK